MARRSNNHLGLPIVDEDSVEVLEYLQPEDVLMVDSEPPVAPTHGDMIVTGATLDGKNVTLYDDGTVGIPLNSPGDPQQGPAYIKAELELDEANDHFSLVATGNIAGGLRAAGAITPATPVLPARSAYDSGLGTQTAHTVQGMIEEAEQVARNDPKEAKRMLREAKSLGSKEANKLLKKMRFRITGSAVVYASALVIPAFLIPQFGVPMVTDMFGERADFVDLGALPNVGEAFEGPIDVTKAFAGMFGIGDGQ